MWIRKVLVGSICALVALPALSLVREQQPARPGLRVRPAQVSTEQIVADREHPTFGAVIRSFETRYGGEWSYSIDSRTGRANLVQGSGIPFVPGRGNRLGSDALAGIELTDGELTVDALEPSVRAFLESNRSMIDVPVGTLELNRTSSGIRDDGRLATFNYDWKIGGVPVEGALVFVRMNSGNITQFGAPRVGPTAVDPSPTIDVETALRTLYAYTGDEEMARLRGEPQLVIQTEGGPAGSLEYRLVWKIEYRLPDRIETWEARIDARTGEIVGYDDLNKYARVVGGVYPRTTFDDNETSVPFPGADAIVDGNSVEADNSGAYAYSGGPVSSGLNGRYFDTACSSCTNPSAPTVSQQVGSGRIDFGLGGDDEIGNDFSTPADRNTFYHLNQIRRLAIKWMPAMPYLNQLSFTSNVNIFDTCNAVFTGDAVNFFRAGGGCNNTGEIADVVYHEYGHGVDLNSLGGDGATGEATADVVSMHYTRSAIMGPGFNVGGGAVRILDKNINSFGLLTTGNVDSKCGPGQNNGPLGNQVHCEGQIYGQTAWDLSQALIAKYGNNTGWRTSERIFFLSLPDAASQLPASFPENSGPAIYDAYLNADDDDGNLGNGTPNGQEIFDAFDLHGIAGTPTFSSPGCARPAQPAVSVTPQCDGFDLSWNAIPGVDQYEVLRAEILQNSGYFPVTQVPAGQATFTDSEVAPGIDYHYVVMSIDANGCESTVENPVTATLPTQPILSVTAAISDDEPRGNRSGFADPGEEVDLVVTLQNLGTAGASTLDGSLISSTTGTTILEGVSDWPDLVPGGSSTNLGVLRFETDDQEVSCGDRVRFQLQPAEGSGCAADTSFFEVTMGEAVAEFADDFEADLGWQFDAANSTATTGGWLRGDPVGTGFQPGDDFTVDGTNCWYTGANPGGQTGTDDVDDGNVILLSPIYDLSALTIAEVSYYRWFALSVPGDDAGDFFAVDVSNDGGANWINLETLDTNSPASSWARRAFRLDEILPLTSQMQFRFEAQDGTATGGIVEAAIDDFAIERFVCDDTPACFVEPTFAGLQTATSGGSCGEVQLDWQAASSNCINATISYNVYRSLDPGFTPGPGSLVVEGLTGTSLTDALLDPDQTYHYVVRAYDSRSGEETNSVVRSALAPSTPDVSAPIFGGLMAAAPGTDCAETVLSWAPAQESCSGPVIYDIFRSEDPGFAPDASNRVASTFETSFIDVASPAGTALTYVVRARDDLGNADTNEVRLSTTAALLDLTVSTLDFEPNDAGWTVSGDVAQGSSSGPWEWGNPQATPFQPENDATDGGVNCWITGLINTGSNNDVDDGTTILTSRPFQLGSTTSPVVSYSRWFTNNQGNSPGDPTDTFKIEVTNDDGQNWTLLEEVSCPTQISPTECPLEWVAVDNLPLPVPPTDQVRLRFTASDLGDGSLVEAGIDELSIIDVGQGCSQCGPAPSILCDLDVFRDGDDIVVDWATPLGRRVLIYNVTGCGERTLVGTVDGPTEFRHVGAALSSEPFNYRITYVDGCGVEVPFCGTNDCP